MAINIYDFASNIIAQIEKVISCTVDEKLSGVKTLSFETILTSALETISDTDSYMVEFENDLFDVSKTVKSLKSGMYMISFTCEHVSYRLSDYPIKHFASSGTISEILDLLLSGTPFTKDDVEPTQALNFAISESTTKRSVVMKLAIDNGYDIHFNRFKVSIINHRGSIIPKDIIDKNVLSISKTTDKFKGTNSYALSLYSPDEVEIGDEVNLKFSKLGIDTVVRVMGMKRQPYSSKSVTLEVGSYEVSIEDQTTEIISDAVNKNQNYYGVKISNLKGLEIIREDEKAKVIMNADEFRMQAKDGGVLKDKLYFDPVTGTYKFVGTVSIMGGSIDIGGHFKVDPNGNAYLTGDSTIYGGKYYAGAPGDNSGFSQMTPGGFEVFNAQTDLKLRFGYTTQGEDFPFVQLGSGSGSSTDYGLIKKFSDGLWIGNSDPADESGTFTPKAGYNGIFFKFSDNTAYIVRDTVLKNIYTGAAIAKFG